MISNNLNQTSTLPNVNDKIYVGIPGHNHTLVPEWVKINKFYDKLYTVCLNCDYRVPATGRNTLRFKIRAPGKIIETVKKIANNLAINNIIPIKRIRG